MKTKYKITLISSTALLLISCATQPKVSPSQNKDLTKYTSGTHKSGYLQSHMDKWIEDEWEPTVSKDAEIQKKYPKTKKNTAEKSERSFTLQEYVDKAVVYRRDVADSNNSHSKKIESLPVIGK